MKLSKKSQTAVEMIILLTVIVGILIIIISISSNVFDSASGRFETAKAKSAVDEISLAAEQVYLQGSGSKKAVFVTLPENLISANVSNNIVNIKFISGGNVREVYRKLDFPLQGEMPLTSGNSWVYLSTNNGVVILSSNAASYVCGNNITDAGEECDGAVSTISETNYPEVVYADLEWSQRVLALRGNNGIIKWNSSQLSFYADKVAVGDVNLDGIADVVAGKIDANKIYALYGQNGTVIWSHTLSVSGDKLKSNIIVDNGKIYLGGKKKKFYAINGSTGSEIWLSSDFPRSNIDSIVIGKFNNDSANDIAITNIGNKEIYAYSGTNGNTIWALSMSNSAKSSSRLLTNDTNADGFDDIFVGTSYDRVYLINGSNGKELWMSSDIGSDADSIAVGDFNHDNIADVAVMADWQNYVYAFNGKNGSLMWQYNANWDNAYALESADLNNDGFFDVIYGDWNNNRYVAVYGNNGTTMYVSSQRSDEIVSMAVYDVNLDGVSDVITAGWDNKIIAFYGANGSIMWNYTSTENTNSNVVVGDVGN